MVWRDWLQWSQCGDYCCWLGLFGPELAGDIVDADSYNKHFSADASWLNFGSQTCWLLRRKARKSMGQFFWLGISFAAGESTWVIWFLCFSVEFCLEYFDSLQQNFWFILNGMLAFPVTPNMLFFEILEGWASKTGNKELFYSNRRYNSPTGSVLYDVRFTVRKAVLRVRTNLDVHMEALTKGMAEFFLKILLRSQCTGCLVLDL